MLYLVGYLVSGAVTFVGVVIYIVCVLPYTCCYDMDDWNEFFLRYMKELSGDQSRFEDLLGWMYLIFLWPLKMTWLLCDIIPNAVSMYETQFKKD